MKPCPRSSTGGDKQVSHIIPGRETYTCSPQDNRDDLLVDHVMAEIIHLSASPRTRSDEDLYSILVRLTSAFYTCTS